MRLFDFWKKNPKPIDLTHTSRFTGKWVCLDEKNRVCGVGVTAREALYEAEGRNYKMPTLLFVNPNPWH